MRDILSLILLLGVMPFAAQAESYVDDPAGQAPVVLASVNTDDFSGGSGVTNAAPVFAAPRGGYVARASGLDRIDPSSFTMLGGQIGGNGVQGGAVVSLTWPTVR